MPQNPRAFPLSCQSEDDYVQDGMSLRDWFAGNAPVYPFRLPDEILTERIANAIAEWRYAYADAMLAEKERREKKSNRV